MKRALLVLFVLGCAPPPEPEPEFPSCGDVAVAICEPACACGDGECSILGAEGGFAVSFPEESDCGTLFALGCGIPPEGRQACIDAMAPCGDDPEPGVIEQPECEPVEE